MKKNLLVCCLSLFVSSGFAIECQNMDEKLISLDASKLNTNVYNKKVSANKIEWIDYKLINNSYTGGRWQLKNKEDDNMNASGFAICVDNDQDLNFKNIVRGPYCWCNVDTVDNYRVSGNWYKSKEFDRHQFDEKDESKKGAAKEKNIQECMNDCAKYCQDRYATLIHTINGFYNCGRAIYKLQDVRCVIDKKFVNAKTILVFDDMAEIQMLGGGSIVFTPENDNVYVGKYENDIIYLKLKNKSIYVGRDKYSENECL